MSYPTLILNYDWSECCWVEMIYNFHLYVIMAWKSWWTLKKMKKLYWLKANANPHLFLWWGFLIFQNVDNWPYSLMYLDFLSIQLTPLKRWDQIKRQVLVYQNSFTLWKNYISTVVCFIHPAEWQVCSSVDTFLQISANWKLCTSLCAWFWTDLWRKSNWYAFARPTWLKKI